MERVEVMLDPLRAFLYQAGAFLPRIGLAVLILIAGVVLAKIARFAIERGLRAINLHIVTRRSGLDSLLQEQGTDTDTVSVFGLLLYWLVILAALIMAFNALGLQQVTDLLQRALIFVLRLGLALLILAFGSYFARFVGQTITSYCEHNAISDGVALGRFAQYAILAFVVVVAVDELDIAGTLLRTAFLIVLGGVVLAVALAFGLGGKDWAAARLEQWWPSDPDAAKPPPSHKHGA